MKVDENVKQLLNDDYFVKWIVNPDHECESFWRVWMERDPARAEYVNEAKQYIIGKVAFDKQALSSTKREAIWNTIQNRIQQPEKQQTSTWYGKVVRYAAIVVVIISAVAVFRRVVPLEPEAIAAEDFAREAVAPNGTRITLHLNDGTTINLNAGSRIRYPEKFSSGKREVFLEGEAFFQVKRDIQRPFIVHSENIQTTVLGTTFNIKAYPGSDQVDVALVTGTVVVMDTIRKDNAFQLVPSQRATYSKRSQQIVRSSFDLNEIARWKDGIITFKDASFDEIEETLERWYGVEFIVRKKPNVENDFNGSFDNESLETVLKGLSFSLNFEYVIRDKTIYIGE
ncbi:MAG TPA: DUF4974 domain-containing protein [Cyclobacteriaceae bacterium]|nr:DUF4974 domain-containing protein [Cyclobacteriaceae bacterium]